MKALLKTLLILVIVAGLAAGGIYGYSRYTLSQPCEVQPVGNWLLEYSPNQTYLGGSVTSGQSLILYRDRDRTPLEIYVTEGQTIRAGDPLIRYDTTKDNLDLDEKLLARQKLYDSLQPLYKEYAYYAFQPYERTMPTATPTFTPTPRNYQGTGADARGGLSAQRLSAPVQRDLVRIDLDGDGSEERPYRYRLSATSTLSDPIPESLLTGLQAAAAVTPVHAWFETDLGYLYITFLPPDAASGRINARFAAMTEKAAPTGEVDLNELRPASGSGTLKDPYIFPYTEGETIPGPFLARYCREAGALGAYLYVELQGRKLTVAADFTSMGTYILRLKATPVSTPTPSPTPTPTPTPSPTPEPTPTATPEGWIEDAEPYEPPLYYGAMGRAERLAYVEQLAQQIRDGELQYRQLCHDIALLTASAENGTLNSAIDGVVAKLTPDAKAGEPMLEIRGGSGKSVISCMLGETDLNKYPVGTELTGFSYDIGSDVTARVTYVGSMPVMDNYSNGGNPNSSGYTMLLEVQGDTELPLYSYVEFTSFEPLSKSGTIYLYEAFVREIDGQDCIFVARDGILHKVPVHTGRRVMEYIELVGSDLTREDYIAFPYGKTVRDGASVVITDGSW